MLQRIHEHIKGWVAGLVLVAISASFILWGVEYYVSGTQQGGGAVAKVNGKKISNEELNQLARQVQQRVVAEGQVLTSALAEQLKAFALQNLIMRTILTQAVLSENYYVGKQQVDFIIESMPQFQQNGQFSAELFQQVLYQNGLSPTQFQQQLMEDILLNQASTGIQNTDFVLPNELKTAFGLLHQTRDFSYLIISAKDYVAQTQITDAMLHTYYQQNSQKFMSPETVQLEYILLSPTEISSHIKISDAEAQQYYEGRRDTYKIPQQWTVEHIFIPLAANASATTVKTAQKTIDDITARLNQKVPFATILKEQNGFTQTVSQRDISAQYSRVLASLKPSAVSAPFRTAEGWNIVHLLSVQPEKMQSFEMVKENIKRELAQQKTQATLSQMNDQLSNLTYTNPDSLQPAAEALKVKTAITAPITKQGEKTGITADPKVLEAAFSDEVLTQGNNSDPIVLKDNSVVVLRVKKHEVAREKSFDMVKDQIKTILQNESAQAQAAIVANKIQFALMKGQDIQSLLNENHLVWANVKAIQHDNKQIPLPIVKAAFQLNLQTGQNIEVVSLDKGDVAVVKLVAMQTANFDSAAPKDRDAVAQTLKTQNGQIAYRLYVSALQQKAKIKIYSQTGN